MESSESRCRIRSMTTQQFKDDPEFFWSRGEVYDVVIGRLSQAIAQRFLPWLEAPKRVHWLDAGCGTGIVTRGILQDLDPSRIDAIDPSESYLSYASKQITDPRVRFHLTDIESMDFPPESFDAIASGLMLQFLSDPEAELLDLLGLLRTDGIIGAYVWDFSDPAFAMRIFWDAAIALNLPNAAESDPVKLHPLYSPANMEALFRHTFLRDVQTERIVCPVVFPHFNDFWSIFSGYQCRGTSYLATLLQPDHLLLKDEVQKRVKHDKDGSLHMDFIATAVKGRK